jgi:hypothetical protein
MAGGPAPACWRHGKLRRDGVKKAIKDEITMRRDYQSRLYNP